VIKSEGFIALDWLGRPVRRRSGAGGLVVVLVVLVVLVVVVLHDVPDVVDGVDFVFVLGGGMKNLVVVDVVGWWVGCFLFVLGGAVVLLGRVWGGAGGGFVVALEEEEEEEEEEDEEEDTALNWCRALLVSLGAAEGRLGFTEATGTFLNGARVEDPRAAEEEPPLSPLDDFLISPRPLFVRCLFLADDLAANSRFRWFRS